MEALQGRAWKFGDNVDTDLIVPGRYLDAPMEEATRHVLESVRPGFADEVRAGDIIVAGANFGCGSSRESAPLALQALGIGCVVAESFGRIFFRNSIAVGLPALVCPGVSSSLKDGDAVRVDVERARVDNLTSGGSFQAEPLCEEMLLILGGGGILEVLKSMLGAER